MPRYVKEHSGRYAVYYHTQRLGIVQQVQPIHGVQQWRAIPPTQGAADLMGDTSSGRFSMRRKAAAALAQHAGIKDWHLRP